MIGVMLTNFDSRWLDLEYRLKSSKTLLKVLEKVLKLYDDTKRGTNDSYGITTEVSVYLTQKGNN